ncbi:uncharacterized protein HMPREF1541_03467 [Cyphellophora europaea CBS 101466]|uniref:Fe2OG dioxygenase domain-containing protein n=1 Tax=Cyphellophora europaea (strain CBS 101466) TaxID=1220924 RepID=W2RYF7_CYPE1|nr:uncharacterized protein HMPREF1541_03467 [Cyphellophora europaea CBS 101466]ETN41531.1 hypothetical protein HMPREF1541_03467 [Cyphellophora europaea CBS 101466]
MLPATLLSLLVLPVRARQTSQQKPLQALACPDHKYKVHLVSRDPLVIYIPEFITAEEAKHLQESTSDKFSRSGIADESGAQRQAETRTSSSASLSARDDIIRCIEERARTFQSPALPRSHLEPLQLVKYGVGEQYHEHTDWFTSSLQAGPEFGGNRLSSFFVYVQVSEDIVGGGTRFPFLDAPGVPKVESLGTGFFKPGVGGATEEWCGYVDCDEPWDNGLTFRPVERSAVFWMNLLPGGRGDERTLHAGLPVTKGQKTGMNIWTREGPLDDKYRGDD